MDSLYLIGVAVLALLAFVLAIVLFNFFGLWLRARIANAPVNIGKGGVEELPHQGAGEISIRLLGEQEIAILPDVAQIGELVLVVALALDLRGEAIELSRLAEQMKIPGAMINKLLQDQPDTVNSDPQGEGWFFKIKLADIAQLDALMNETEYNNMIQEQG